MSRVAAISALVAALVVGGVALRLATADEGGPLQLDEVPSVAPTAPSDSVPADPTTTATDDADRTDVSSSVPEPISSGDVEDVPSTTVASEGDPPPPPPGDGSPRFVTGVSSRSLVDQEGDSLYLVADAGWSLIGALDRGEISQYLDLLVQRKHNGVLFNMIENGFSSNPPAAAEPSAGTPFQGAMFSSPPNEAYWSHLDWVIAEMENRGLTAIANPVYAGYIDQHGVGAQMVAATNQQMRSFGEYVGNRYKNRINIAYQIGGDRNFDPNSTLGERYAALADGIRSRDPSKVMTVMTGPDNYSSAMWNPNWLDFEAVYENDSADLALLDIWDSTSKPLIYAEPAYEGARWPDTGWSRLYGRRELYVSFANGYSGIIPGNCLRWHFEQDPQGVGCSSWGRADWPRTLEDTSRTSGPDRKPADQHAADTQRFAELVATLPWPSMRPDTTNRFLVDGTGNGADRAAARLGNQTGLVYLPAARNITIDTTRIAPRVSLHWYDPTTGTTTTITPDEAATTNRVVQHPGPNNTGDNDWILLTRPST